MNVTLRNAEESDNAFLLRVYASTREQEMALVPWSSEQKADFVAGQFKAQLTFYRAKYPDAQHSIICSDGKPVGRIFLARKADEFRIADITVLPEFRGAGIGSCILRNVIEEASHAGKPISIFVEVQSPSRHLLEKLGFRRIDDDGFNVLMTWDPSRQSDGLAGTEPRRG